MKLVRLLKEFLWGYSRPALLLWVIILIYAGRVGILAIFPRSIRQNSLVSYGSLALAYGLFLLLVWFFVRQNQKLRQELGLCWAGGKLAIGLGGGLGAIALGVVLVRGGQLSSRAPADSLETWLVVIVGTTLLVPLVEELIFRGLLMAYLLEWLPRRLPFLVWPMHRVAIGLSALAFALAHVGSSFLFLLVLFGGGLIYGWVRWRSNSLLPSFVGHAAWNGILALGQFVNWLN